MSELVIEYLGGKCPVQGEGEVDGEEFYFRSRGDSWSMSIGGPDVIGEPKWYYEEDYGQWPDAGWISEDEALSFIRKAADLYRASLRSLEQGGE